MLRNAFILVIVLLSIPIVLSARFDVIKDVVGSISQVNESYVIAVGEYNDARDVRAAVNFGKFIKADFANYKLDTEIDPFDFPEEYLIVIGGPCANTLWAKYSSVTCGNWPWGAAKAIVEVTEKDGKTILLVAGSTGPDTESIVDALIKTYFTDPIFGNAQAIIQYTNFEKEQIEKGVYHCGNAVCDKEETYEVCPSDCDEASPTREWDALYNMKSSVTAHIAVDDIDGDGFKEIIVPTSGKLRGFEEYGEDPARLYVFNYVNGELIVKNGWPYLFTSGGADSSFSSPAIGVIDSTLEKRIVIPFMNQLFAFDAGGNIVTGWPQNVDVRQYQSPVLADMDNDGVNEIIFPSRGSIKIWRGNGVLINSFILNSDISIELRAPAVADLDGDTVPEIIAVSDEDFSSSIYVINADGSSLPGWPQKTGLSIVQPTITDVNNDGKNEILIVLRDDKKVQIYDLQGTLVDEKIGSQFGMFIGSAVVAQLDKSTVEPEIILGDRKNNLHVFNSPLNVWPKQVAPSGGFHTSSAVIADVNADGDLDIIIGSDGSPPNDIDKNLYAFSYSTGELVQGYPKASSAGFRSSPIIADLDNDGNLEVVIGSEDGYLYLAKGLGAGPILWSQNGGSPERKNVLE